MTTTRFAALLLATASAAVALGCAKEAQVHTASLSTAPFDKYRTFSFAPPEKTPEGYDTSPRRAAVLQRIQPAIVEALQQKGYTLASGKGDLVIAFATGRRDAAKRRYGQVHTGWLGENEEDDFVEGAIVIDGFDGSNDGQVWHGASKAQIDPDKLDPALIDRSVREILASFPPARPSPASPAP